MQLTVRTLGEICDEAGGTIKTGPFGSQLHESDYTEEGTPVIMPKNIVEGKILTDGIARIGDDDVERLSKHKVKKGDIIYGRRGDIGRRALITSKQDGWICGTGCIRISLGESVINPSYLYYYLGQPKVIAWIYNQAIGATMPNLNTTIIRSIPIAYPALSIQHKIASILSAYDDLIENNIRRIQILEEMAQSLYNEWFVNFRFPGHEKVKMIDSLLGKIPEGWEITSLKNLASFIRGVEPGSKYYSEKPADNMVPFLRVGDLSSRSTSIYVPKLLAQGKFLEKSDIALTLDGTVGIVKTGLKGAYSTGIRKVVTNDPARLPASVLYFLLRSSHIQEIIKTHARGTTILHAGSAIEHMDFALPPKHLVTEFDKNVAPLLMHVLVNLDKNNNLRQTRDLLLPKLISGKIDVSELDIDAGGLIA